MDEVDERKEPSKMPEQTWTKRKIPGPYFRE